MAWLRSKFGIHESVEVFGEGYVIRAKEKKNRLKKL